MQRIIDVEKPFHTFVYQRISSELSIVQFQNRDGENDRHLHQSVHLINSEEIYRRIYRHIKDHPQHLGFEFSPVRSKGHNTERRYAAPVTWKAYDANQDNQQNLHRLAANLLTHRDPQHDKSPGEGPHHTGLVQRIAIIERQERFPIHKIHGRENVGKVGNNRKTEQSHGVFVDVSRIVVSFRYEIAHDRTGYPADDMHDDRQGFLRISRERRPGDVVYGHSQDGNDLYGICV